MTPDQKGPDPVAEMRLRPNPRPVLRLSRKMLIGLGAASAIALAAALAFAVTPQHLKPAQPAASTDAAPRTRPSSEALDALPKDYSAVPKLGPPLPGDLGRPILAGQINTSEAAYATLPPPPPGYGGSQSISGTQPDPTAQARDAARGSQLFFAPSAAEASAPAPVVPVVNPLADMNPWPVPEPADPKSDPDRKRAYLDRVSDRQPVSPERLNDPASPYLLLTGSVIPAALITGIRSDIPGQVLAQVTEDVRDTLTGEYLLIPKGARLIGQYDNAVSFGQSRLLLTWSRLILPNGRSLILEKLSAADASGYAGLHDRTDNHWRSTIGAAATSTLLGIGAQSGSPETDSELVRAIRDGAGDSINRAGQAIVERQLNIQPTVTIRPGLPVRVILSRDLVLEPYGG
ncbi:TrbI/VirB10 family protein [Asticcacaulis taihuensis]|uniref:TrbI/VirB10 family protein n=1 Tax=Asticcacaulis taihuensis TaxID=260084 RepID=UPI0026E9F11A|nr:TrbI/VirB10 family protein [Asticcacaulis taihuensis]